MNPNPFLLSISTEQSINEAPFFDVLWAIQSVDQDAIAVVNDLVLGDEPAEMDVLSGAVETIRRFRPVVIFEHSPYTSEERNLDPNKIIEFFKSLNYSFLGSVSGS